MGRSKKLQKSLQVYLSKKLRMRRVPNIQFPINAQNSTSWILSACKYPRTPSFAVSRDNADAGDANGATLSDVERFLHENFHSLYIRDDDDATAPEPDPDLDPYPYPYPDPDPDPVRSSDRFFVSPGATSNSIMLDRARPDTSASSASSSATSASAAAEVDGGGDDVAVAVVTFSKDPYEDFRRSMMEMVDARHVEASQPLDWDFMEELLFCYLELNDKSVHRYILTAFTDLTVSFRRRRDPPTPDPENEEQWPRRRSRRKATAAIQRL